MRLRRRNQEMTSDSVLDIVSNVVGVMVLIAVVVVVSSRHMAVALSVPVLREPTAENRVIVECANNEVFFLDEKGLHTIEEESLLAEIDRRGTKFESWTEIAAFVEEQDLGNETYRIRIEPGYDGQWRKHTEYIIRDDARGDGPRELRKEGAKYARLLKGLNPDEDFIYFIVREDSFGAFRVARNMARDRGIATGWHPRSVDSPLSFSARGGHKTEVQ